MSTPLQPFPTELARRLIEGSPDAIVVCDPQGVVRFWNHGAERIFGFSAADATGQSLDLIIPEPLRARHWAGWHQAIERGYTKYEEGRLLAVPALTHAGTRISIEFSMQLLKGGDGRVEWIAAVIRDVTERYQAEKALRQELASLRATSGRSSVPNCKVT